MKCMWRQSSQAQTSEAARNYSTWTICEGMWWPVLMAEQWITGGFSSNTICLPSYNLSYWGSEHIYILDSVGGSSSGPWSLSWFTISKFSSFISCHFIHIFIDIFLVFMHTPCIGYHFERRILLPSWYRHLYNYPWPLSYICLAISSPHVAIAPITNHILVLL